MGQASLDDNDDDDLKKVNYIIKDLKEQANYIIEDLKEDLKKQASYIKDLKEDLKKQVGDIEDLKEQVEELRRANAQVRRKLAVSSRDLLLAAWYRFTKTLSNSRDTQESLVAAQLECSQCEMIQRHLTDALRLLSKPHDAAGAAEAYRRMYTCPAQPCTDAWKASAVGLRANVILRCWCQAACCKFSSIEAVLRQIYGPRFSEKDLRSQLLKAYDHLFPGARTATRARAGARAARPRAKRARSNPLLMPESGEVQPLSEGPAETETEGVAEQDEALPHDTMSAWELPFDLRFSWLFGVDNVISQLAAPEHTH